MQERGLTTRSCRCTLHILCRSCRSRAGPVCFGVFAGRMLKDVEGCRRMSNGGCETWGYSTFWELRRGSFSQNPVPVCSNMFQWNQWGSVSPSTFLPSVLPAPPRHAYFGPFFFVYIVLTDCATFMNALSVSLNLTTPFCETMMF